MTAGLLRALAARAAAENLPPPAALVGHWWDAEAVIAPSIEVVAGLGPPDKPDCFWFGYLGFPVQAENASLPTVAGGLTDGVLVLRNRIWTWVSARGAACPDWVDQVLTAHTRATTGGSGTVPEAASTHPAGHPWHTRWQEPNRADHQRAVAACREAIAAGEIYQACICTQFTGHLDGAALDYFADLTAATTPAKAAFLQGQWGAVVSLSPELFLARRGATVHSSPIKGTAARHTDPARLAASAKDVAENIMIVDLVRNDLGAVARTGSVHVPELLQVVAAPAVWHLVSTVSAELDIGVGNTELLAATFPPASVTGTPKIRAAELIAQWEPAPRGVYCGAVGMAGPDGLLDLNVAIRTVTVTPHGALTLGVGGGITYDSEAAAEWQECLDKAAAIVGFTSS